MEISAKFEIDFGEIVWKFGLDFKRIFKRILKKFWENNCDKNFGIFSVNFKITENLRKTFKETTESWEKF